MDTKSFFASFLAPKEADEPAALSHFKAAWQNFQENLSHQQMTSVDSGASIFRDGAYDRENPIRRCLDDMLYYCEQEEEAALRRGAGPEEADSDSPLPDFGPVMLFVLEHHIFEQVCTAGKSDLPLGMKALALRTLSRAASHTRHPLLLHPTTRNSIAELVAVSSPALPPVFYSTNPTNVIASMGASPTAAASTTSTAGTNSHSSTSSAGHSSAAHASEPPVRIARRARLASAVDEHLLSLLSAIWGHATAEPALVASLEHAASGIAQYRSAVSSAPGKVSASSAPISLWLRGVLGLLPSPRPETAQAAADVLLTVLMVRDSTVVQWLHDAQHITAACIAGAVAEAWDEAARQPLPLSTLPSTQWPVVQREPPVRRLLSALRCAVVCVDLCAERHPALAACVSEVLLEHVVAKRMAAAVSAAATQEQRASQCVLLQLVLAELAACSIASPLRVAVGGDSAAARAATALLRSLLVGQPLVNLVEAVRRGASYLMTAGCFLLADVCQLAPQLLPEAVAADNACLPKEFEQHPLPAVAKLVNDTLSSSQTRLWELTRQSSRSSDAAATTGPDPAEVHAALGQLLSASATEGMSTVSPLQLSPDARAGEGQCDEPPPHTPGSPPHEGAPDSTAIAPRPVVLAAFKIHVAIASALANWCAPDRTVDMNVALSGLLSAALQWQPVRILLMGSKKRPQQSDAATATLPVACSLAAALQHAWNKSLQGAAEHTRSMGRTPFQAALLARKLQLGLPGATCDEGDGSEVAVLAAAAASGSADPAVQRVLDGAAAQLDKLIILDEVSNECQTTMRGLLAEVSQQDSAPASPAHDAVDDETSV